MLALECACTPGGDDTPLASQVIPSLNDGNTVFDARIRRIHFEAYASTMAEFQRRAQRGEESSRVQQVPPEERANRLKAFKAKYPGLTVDRELEPGDSLVDKMVDVQERGVPRFFSWHDCITKQSELDADQKPDPLPNFF